MQSWPLPLYNGRSCLIGTPKSYRGTIASTCLTLCPSAFKRMVRTLLRLLTVVRRLCSHLCPSGRYGGQLDAVKRTVPKRPCDGERLISSQAEQVSVATGVCGRTYSILTHQDLDVWCYVIHTASQFLTLSGTPPRNT